MSRPGRIVVFAASLMLLASTSARGQAQAGGENPKKVVLVELFTSQG